MIDKNNGIDYPKETLHQWKREHEKWVLDNLNKSVIGQPTNTFSSKSENQSGGITANVVHVHTLNLNAVDDKKNYDKNKYQEFKLVANLNFTIDMLNDIKHCCFILSTQDSHLYNIQYFLKQRENSFFSEKLKSKMSILSFALFDFKRFRDDYFELKELNPDTTTYLCPKLYDYYYEDEEKTTRFKEKQQEMISKIVVIEETIIEIIEIAKNELGL